MTCVFAKTKHTVGVNGSMYLHWILKYSKIAILFSFKSCKFSMCMLGYFQKCFKNSMSMKTLKNWPQKLHTYGSLNFLFSTALTAQKSPRLEILVSRHICSLICVFKATCSCNSLILKQMLFFVSLKLLNRASLNNAMFDGLKNFMIILQKCVVKPISEIVTS